MTYYNIAGNLHARNHNHSFRPMAEIDKGLRAHYRGHLTVLHSALAANCVQGNRIDQSIDEIGESCEKMKKSIKQQTEEQVYYDNYYSTC